MAVYTRPGAHELRIWLDQYDVGALHAIADIEAGVENSNFSVNTKRGAFILTLIERRVGPKALPYILGLTRHLADKGLSVSAPLRALEGGLSSILAGRPAILAERFPGETIDQPTEVECGQIGDFLARMHRAGQSYDQKRPADLTVPAWRAVWEDCRSKAQKQVDTNDFVDLIDRELAYLEEEWPDTQSPGLPKGPCHNDLFPDNVLAMDGSLTGVIDFYFAADDFFAYDLAVTINAWCFDGDATFRKGRAKRLVEHYDSARPLTAAEDKALPLLMRGAAIRFLLTRLHDWLNPVDGAIVTPKQPGHFAAILKTHQRMTDLADYLI